MNRSLVLAVLLAFGLTSCSRCSHEESPPPAAPATEAPATAASPPAAAPAPAPAAAPAQSETEQARGAQESSDGAINEKPESGDASLESQAPV